jgi:hypothetical protein
MKRIFLIAFKLSLSFLMDRYANWSTYMYDVYLAKMASNGGNYVRIWIGLSCDDRGNTPLSLAGA